jgi:hypothetical protein
MLLQYSLTRFITLGFLGDELVDFYADVAVRQSVHERIKGLTGSRSEKAVNGAVVPMVSLGLTKQAAREESGLNAIRAFCILLL